MSEDKKNKIWAATYSAIGGFLVGVMLLGIQGFSSDKTKLNNKVDKTEFHAEMSKKLDKETYLNDNKQRDQMIKKMKSKIKDENKN